MHRFEYLLLLGACLLITLPLEWIFSARVYRRFARTAAVIGVILLVFGLWDVIAILRGHWTYDPLYMIGWDLFGIFPLEEALFFIAIPLCALLTYEAVGTCLGWIRALCERRAPQNHTTPGASRTDGAEEARHG